MNITFAQYSILMAAQNRANYSQLEQKTKFDHMLISYYIMGLLNVGLLSASDQEANENTYYQLTDEGEKSIEEYEHANPDLVIKSVQV